MLNVLYRSRDCDVTAADWSLTGWLFRSVVMQDLFWGAINLASLIYRSMRRPNARRMHHIYDDESGASSQRAPARSRDR